MNRVVYTFIAGASMISSAFSADFAGCDVGEIVITGDQNAHVALSCAVQNAPACATAAQYVGFDKSTASGKQYLALLIYAQASGAKVEGYVVYKLKTFRTFKCALRKLDWYKKSIK